MPNFKVGEKKLNIKKVDDKPMVIHTKEKTKLHIKAEPEAKIKGRNVLVVEKGPKVARVHNVDKTDTKRMSANSTMNGRKRAT